MTPEPTCQASALHPHEPEIPPCIAADGHCRVCRLSHQAELQIRELRDRLGLLMGAVERYGGSGGHPSDWMRLEDLLNRNKLEVFGVRT